MKKIFRTKCPWDKRKITIFLNEEKLEELKKNLQLPDNFKIQIKRWWQSKHALKYLKIRLKISRKKYWITLGKHKHWKSSIDLYPDFILRVPGVRNLDDLKRKFLFYVAHEFGHAYQYSKDPLSAFYGFMSEDLANDFAKKQGHQFEKLITIKEKL